MARAVGVPVGRAWPPVEWGAHRPWSSWLGKLGRPVCHTWLWARWALCLGWCG